MHAIREFVSIGVNRVVNALDWAKDGRVAYGGHHAVVIYDPKAAVVTATLLGHTAKVDCVKWLAAPAEDLPLGTVLLASGAADSALRIWAVHTAGAEVPWECIAELQGHSGPITALATYYLSSNDGLMLVSVAGDANVLVWQCQPRAPAVPSMADTGQPGQIGSVSMLYGQAAWKLQQRVPMGNKIQHAVALTNLPHDPAWLLLATGGTDGTVHLLLRPPGATAFVAACQLAGHENWIRSLAFCHIAAGEPAAATSEDGVRSELARCDGGLNELVLASASQDRYARIWSIKLDLPPSPAVGVITSASVMSAEQGLVALSRMISRYAPKPVLVTDKHRYCASAEALLIGHEDWVHSVCWRPPASGRPTAQTRSELCLMTASMDRTMVLWRYKAGSGLWMNEMSVGDAGASCLGYFGGIFSHDGQSIMAHGFTGALHLWHCPSVHQQTAHGQRSSSALWQPAHALGGHFGAVVEARWGIDGACLLTASEDQTARMFTTVGNAQHWCEVARMQVHGHDFSCIAPLRRQARQQQQYWYVSGSEEKVLRVFESPTAFLDTLAMARGQPRPSTSSDTGGYPHGRALGAAVAALGLTNKAVYSKGDDGESNKTDDTVIPGVTDNTGPGYDAGPDMLPASAPSAVMGPPLEEHLSQNTLWPETHKLYGHGNDIYCCAASPDARYLASACRAQTAKAAAIWVWSSTRPDATTGKDGGWRAAAQLSAHTLTVTQLAWSAQNGGQLLAASSRDRSFSIFRRRPPPQLAATAMTTKLGVASIIGGTVGAAVDEDTFTLVRRVKAAHGRVIWGLAWAPDDQLLATASRDESIKLWAIEPELAASSGEPGAGVAEVPSIVLASLGSAVTAVAFAPRCDLSATEESACSTYTLAAGMEDGGIQLWDVQRVTEGASTSSGSVASAYKKKEGGPAGGGLMARLVWSANVYQRHAAAVRSLDWRLARDDLVSTYALQLASAGDDHAIRIFSFLFHNNL